MHNKTTARVLTILSPSIILRAFAMDIFIPCVPLVAAYFAAPFSLTQWVLSIYFLGAGIGQLLLGPLSDRFGRRPIIITSILFFTISSFACAFASSIYWLILLRLAQGIGASGTTVVVVAIIRDLYDDHISAKVYSHVSAIIGLAPLLAPFLGGTLSVWFGSWQSVFYFVTVYGIVALLISHYFIQETSPLHTKHISNVYVIELEAELGTGSGKFKNTLQTYKKILSDAEFLIYLSAAIAGLSGLFLFFSSSSVLIIERLGIPANTYGIYFGMNSLIYMLGNYLSPKLQRRFNLNQIILYSYMIVLLGAILMLIVAKMFGLSIWGLLVPNTVITLGVGLSYGPCAAGAMRKYKHVAGTASATYGALLYCISSLLVTAIMQVNVIDATPIAYTMIVFSLINLLLMHNLNQKR